MAGSWAHRGCQQRPGQQRRGGAGAAAGEDEALGQLEVVLHRPCEVLIHRRRHPSLGWRRRGVGEGEDEVSPSSLLLLSRPAPSTPADLVPATDPMPVGSTAAGSPRGRASSPRRRLEREKKQRGGLMGGVHVAFYANMPRWQATWTKVTNSITSLRW